MATTASKNFKNQTNAVEDGDLNHSPVYRANPQNMNGQGATLTSKLYKAHPTMENVDSIHTAFKYGYNLGPNNRCLGRRQANGSDFLKKYKWYSYDDIEILRNALGSGLMQLSENYCANNLPDSKKFEKGKELTSEALRNIGIMSINKPEWTVFDLACAAYSRVNVPIYDTFGEDAIEHIINHANLGIVLATADKLQSILSCAKKCPCLKVVVCIDSFSEADQLESFLKLDNSHLQIFKNGKISSPKYSSVYKTPSETVPLTSAKLKDYLLLLKSWAISNNVKFLTFEEVLHLGRNKPVPHIPPLPTDIATISYTSGTTGMPKGVILSHLNFASTIQFPVFANFKFMPEEDCLISYLPLAHIFGRVCELSILVCGARVGYYSGDVLRLVEDIQILQPTFFPSVPRLLNRIYIQIQEATVKRSGILGYLFRNAFATKIENLKHRQNWHTLIDNSPLFSKLRAILGGKLKVVITGSAPIDDSVLTFLRACFGCIFVQGYLYLMKLWANRNMCRKLRLSS
eukprot:NODE_219_length_12440_cov_2.445588.p2 type:complete len:517 gc:universal NODE_219_length_12440_cov_2.445588:1921-3471(+)